LNPDTINKNNSFKAPPPTNSEIRLRSILRSKKILFKDSEVIWYTGCDAYTPDLIIGNKLIVEVDGKIHDKEYRKTPDRIRHRALENMGYDVLRVRNEEIHATPDVIAERIIQRYFEGADNDDRRSTKITKLKKPTDYDPMPKEITNNLQLWALSFNKELNDAMWSSVDYFKESLMRLHSKLVTNQCAMERLILLLLGLNLRKREDGSLDFEYSLTFLKKCVEILRGLFGEEEGDMAAIHLKNMYNISAPGFFKNLIFNGGPNINQGIVSIKDEAALNHHIDNFNKSFSSMGITVERREIKSECNATLNKSGKEDNNELSKYNWLLEWMDK
jgi:very-short-patch-repair endonuclease